MTNTETAKGSEGLALLDFPVAKVPVYLALGKEIENHRAIVRPDTGAVLGLVSDSYEVVTHKQSLEPHLERFASEGWKINRVTVERTGAKAWVELHNAIETREVKVGDAVGLRLLIWNSYDGTTGVGTAASHYVTWCLNGAVSLERIFSHAVRHTGGAYERVEKNADRSYDAFGKTVELYRGLADTTVSPEIARKVIQEVCGIKKLDLVKHHWTNDGHGPGHNTDPTAWNLYNAITYYLTHEFGGQIATREAKNREAIDLITNPEKVRELIEQEKRDNALKN